MIELGPCEITGVFGPMASGKTDLINYWLKSGRHANSPGPVHPLANRYCRFDVTGETLDMGGMEHVWTSPRALYQRLVANPFYWRIAYHCGEELETDFRHVLRAVARTDVYKLIIVDEFHEVCSVNQTPKYVRSFLRYARHARIALIAASQRLADVHKVFTGGCRKVIVYTSEEYRDYVAVEDRWGKPVADAWSKMRPLIYDDVNRITHQIPQCLVKERGKAPQTYDFQTNQYQAIAGFSDRHVQREDTGDGDGDDSDSCLPEGQVTTRPLAEETQLQSGESVPRAESD